MPGKEMPGNSPSALRPALLAGAVAVWVTGAWLAPNAWWHSWAVVAVAGGVALNAAEARRWWRETRWAWAVAAFLGWQLVTVAWSDGGGWWQILDTAGVVLLLTGLGAVARCDEWRRELVPLMVWIALFAGMAGMACFYLLQGHALAGERFRLPWVHVTGLNAVLTGLLCAAGAVAALGQGVRGGERFDRGVCFLAVAVCVFGVMATRSRGALLALLAGVVVLAWFERKRIIPGVTAGIVTAAGYFLLLAIRGKGAEELLERGAAGRMDIYHWFLGEMDGKAVAFGAGFGTEPVIPEEVLGWFVEHPHSAYLTQLFVTGIVGLGLMLVVLGWAAWTGLRNARRGDAAWVALLACGGMGVTFDTSLLFSLLTTPRIEPVLVMLPSVMVMGGRK